MPFSSASFFDWVTGKITEMLEPTSTIQENVKCVFLNSGSTQECYTDDGSFKCAGTDTCISTVSGENGKMLRWKSSCGGEVYTTIDGTDKYIEFKCEQPQPVTQEPIQQPAQELVKEQVKCIFINSNSEQKCYSEVSSCAGIGSCIADVSGEKGKTLTWKSTCGGYVSTIIDGNNDELTFNCEVTTVPTPVPATTLPTNILKEQVKCIFANSVSEQKCYSEVGSCAGIGSCIADVSGEKGKTLTWKSTCGGYVYTVIDGNNDYAEFKCETTTTTPIQIPIAPSLTPVTGKYRLYFFWKTDCSHCLSEKSFLEQLKQKYPSLEVISVEVPSTGSMTLIAQIYINKGVPTTFLDDKVWNGYSDSIAAEIEGKVKYCSQYGCKEPSPPIPFIKEQVKCVFANSDSTQKCYTDDGRFGCSGIGTCIADVASNLGTKLTWKSSCGGYAYTIIDGNNDYAEFNCGLTQIPTQTKIPIEVTKEQVKCVFANSNSEQKCYSEAGSCPGIGTCVADVSGEKGKTITWKSTCGGYAYTVMDGNNEYAEFKCEQVQPLPVLKPTQPIPSTQIPSVKEQVRCVFTDPELIQRCYADMGKLGCQNIVRKCYTDDGKFECSDITVASTPLEGGGFKYVPFCVAEVSGEQGTKLTWKSTCGGYGYTVIDGNNEDVEFNCVPSSDVTIEQISGKGFLHAYWQCYDGTEEKSIEGIDMTTCKSSEIWQEYAKKSCENRCYPDRSKCGVNSFSVSGECYIDIEKGGVFISPIEEEKIKERIEEIKERPIEEKKEEILICKDSCPLNGKCYPFGYRKTGKFCFDDGAFKEQLEGDAACENSFECQSNVCIDGKCISSGFIQKIINWFKNLFVLPGREEAKEKITKIVDCGASSECMENAFKICKPAKITQGGSVSEIVGLEGEKCVLKITAGTESMTCKIENYALGTKNLGPMEQYCKGALVKKLSTFKTAETKTAQVSAPVLNSVVTATKLSADPNDQRYSFTAYDPDGIREFSIEKANFDNVYVKVEPLCTKEVTSELKFDPSNLPIRATVIDCGTPVTRHELKVDVQIPIVEEAIPKEVGVPAQTEALSVCEKIRETSLKYKCAAMIKKDPSNCEIISEPAEAYCYSDVALVTGDSAICEKIEDLGHREACEAFVEKASTKCSKWIYADYCYRDVAALISDASVCDQIDYSGGKINCKAVVLKDVSLCQNSDNEDCYQMLALLTGDEKVCDELKKMEAQKGQRPIGISNFDTEVSKCIKMARKEIDGCLFQSGSGIDCDLIPAMVKNPSLCENLRADYPGFSERDRCYFYSAMSLANLLPPELIVLRN